LMRLDWSSFRMGLSKTTFPDPGRVYLLSWVYTYGWDYSDGTKLLKALFQETINGPLQKKSLEDYL